MVEEIPDNPIFALYPDGITEMDEPKLLAMSKRRDAMQPFFAAAIIDLFGKLQRGELKGKTPADLYIGIVEKA